MPWIEAMLRPQPTKEPRYRVEITTHDGWEDWRYFKSRAEAIAQAEACQRFRDYQDVVIYDTKKNTEIPFPGQPERTHADPRGA